MNVVPLSRDTNHQIAYNYSVSSSFCAAIAVCDSGGVSLT